MLDRCHVPALVEIRSRGLRSERIQSQIIDLLRIQCKRDAQRLSLLSVASTWLNELKPSNFVSRWSCGRLETGVRMKRYSKDCVKAILFFTRGPVTVIRGVADFNANEVPIAFSGPHEEVLHGQMESVEVSRNGLHARYRAGQPAVLGHSFRTGPRRSI